MKTALTVIVSLVVGGIIGAFIALGFGTGIGAGVGIVTGWQTGACATLEAARDQGLVSADQFDQVLRSAMTKIAGTSEIPGNSKLPVTAAECDKVMADLRKASSEPHQ